MQQEFIDVDFGSGVRDRPLDLAVIIPTFNEASNVKRLLEKLSLILADIHWEAIFVDDNSPDGTAQLVRSIGIQNQHVRIVHRIGRRGLSSAVIEGILASSAPVVAVIDGDMQHDEGILPQMFSHITSGTADIVVGTRYAEGGDFGTWDKSRIFGSKVATYIAHRVIKAPLSDPMSGFFMLSRATFMQAVPKLSGVGFKVLLDIVSSLDVPPRISEVAYTFRTREAGDSKASALVAAQYLALLAEKTIGKYIPVRLLSFLCIGGMGVGVHLGVLGSMLGAGLHFFTAQIGAVIAAMTFNFFLNNIFTYHDRKLTGWRLLSGLLTFYAVCSVGAAANVGIGTWVNGQDTQWWISGLAGILISSIWNFAASSMITWKK